MYQLAILKLYVTQKADVVTAKLVACTTIYWEVSHSFPSASARAHARTHARTRTHTHTPQYVSEETKTASREMFSSLISISHYSTQCGKMLEFAPLKCTCQLLQYECLSKDTFKNECLLHSKHSVSITQPTWSMFFSEITNFSSKNHNKHINVG
jgi:hypothetical protein